MVVDSRGHAVACSTSVGYYKQVLMYEKGTLIELLMHFAANMSAVSLAQSWHFQSA
jgi:hypothetical protein